VDARLIPKNVFSVGSKPSKILNKLRKDDAWGYITKAMRTVSGECIKTVTSLLSSSEEREEEYGKAVAQEKVCPSYSNCNKLTSILRMVLFTYHSSTFV
jgi:hypothetical protein